MPRLTGPRVALVCWHPTLIAPMLSRYAWTRPIAFTSPQSRRPRRAAVFVTYCGFSACQHSRIWFLIFMYRSGVEALLPGLNHSGFDFLSSSVMVFLSINVSCIWESLASSCSGLMIWWETSTTSRTLLGSKIACVGKDAVKAATAAGDWCCSRATGTFGCGNGGGGGGAVTTTEPSLRLLSSAGGAGCWSEKFPSVKYCVFAALLLVDRYSRQVRELARGVPGNIFLLLSFLPFQ